MRLIMGHRAKTMQLDESDQQACRHACVHQSFRHSKVAEE